MTTRASLPFISCICPTYKRPDMLRNVLACFRAQDYPRNRCELIILDDAGQYASQAEDNWRLISIPKRYPNLPGKFNALLAECRGDLVAVWEDDDIFLPWNLADTARAYRRGDCDFLLPASIWSTAGQPAGQLAMTDPGGLYHSSWRFSRPLVESIGGYVISDRITFDQEFGARLRSTGRVGRYGDPRRPSYVYRWGSGDWNVSQGADLGNFPALWNSLESLPAPPQPPLRPVMDAETLLVYCNHGA